MAYCAYCGTHLAEVSYAPCPNCGNPSNGAPRGTIAPPAPSSGSKTAMIVVIVVIGGFFLVAIIGVLAAIAIPNFITAKQRAMQKRTMADLRTIGTACEAYATDTNHYPEATSVEGLRPILTPTYIRDLPVKDAWQHDLRYGAWSREKELDSYALASAGKDGLFEHDNPQEYPSGGTRQFDCDIVYANGEFVQYPEGTSIPR